MEANIKRTYKINDGRIPIIIKVDVCFISHYPLCLLIKSYISLRLVWFSPNDFVMLC